MPTIEFLKRCKVGPIVSKNFFSTYPAGTFFWTPVTQILPKSCGIFSTPRFVLPILGNSGSSLIPHSVQNRPQAHTLVHGAYTSVVSKAVDVYATSRKGVLKKEHLENVFLLKCKPIQQLSLGTYLLGFHTELDIIVIPKPNRLRALFTTSLRK